MRSTRPHPCPYCRCCWPETDGMGAVNKAAPYYPLVLAIDALSRTRGTA